MDILKLDISDPNFLPEAARKILQFAGETRIFLMEGEMGAGKTTFIKQLCFALGSKENLSSPTYSIINEYRFPAGKIYHFDLYRIRTVEELLDIGFEDYLSGKDYCFIEWPEKALGLLTDISHVSVKIDSARNRNLVAEKRNFMQKI